MEPLSIVLLLLLIAMIAFGIHRQRHWTATELRNQLEQQSLRQRLDEKDRLIQDRSRNFQQLSSELEDARHSLKKSEELRQEKSEQLIRLEEKYEQESKSQAEKLEFLRSSSIDLETKFQNLASRIFEEKNTAFLAKSREGIDAVINPFKENISKLEEKINQVFSQEMRERTSLMENVKHLGAINERVSKEVTHLTLALKGNNKMQGNWGEMILRRLLEDSGMEEGREFFLQRTYTDPEGRKRCPDAIIKMPDNKDVIIDAKVSLAPYDRYLQSEETNEKEKALKELKASFSNHVNTLNGRDYDQIEEINSPGMVLMFIPNESAHLTILREDSAIFDIARSKKILIVGPSTLWAVLKIIESTWVVQRQNESTRQIVEQARKLLEKHRLFMESIENLGDNLEKANKSFDQAKKRLFHGNGNLLATANKLVELGIPVSKALPEIKIGPMVSNELELTD